MHVIMEADEYQDLQPANWKPKGVDGIVLDEVWKVENHGSWLWFYQNFRRLETQKEPKFQFKSDSREKQNKKRWLGFKAIRQEEFPLTQGRVSIFILFKLSTDWKRSMHIRESNLLNSIDWCKCKPETPSKTHQNDIWPNACASHGSVKLIHKINHFKSSPCQLGMHTYLLKPSVIFK